MDRRRFACLATSAGLAALAGPPRIVTSESAGAVPGVMPMARGNPAHTGEQPGPAPSGAPTIRWRFTTNAPIASSPAVADGRVFVGSDDGFLFAVNIADGTVHWGVGLGSRIRTTPAVHHEFVLVANGALHMRGARTGNAINRVENDRYQLTASLVPAEFSGAVVIYGSGINGGSGFVDARDPVSGHSIWRTDVPNHTTTSPSVTGETVVVGTLHGEVRTLAATSGEWGWRLTTGGGILAAPAVAGGLIFAHAWAPGPGQRGAIVPNASGMLHAVDLVSGVERWQAETDSPVESGPAVSAGTVFVGGGPSVFAFDALSGTPRWRFETRGDVRSSPVVADGVVHVGSDDGHLYAIEAESGALRWSLPLGGPVESTAAIVDGLVFVTVGDSLYAVGGS
jgi:outer membrane protein assembly factor BamB